MKFIKSKKLFGEYQFHIYTIEFQKRGLPHVHIALRVKTVNNAPIPVAEIDNYVCARIPNRSDPEFSDLSDDDFNRLCELVTSIMTHKFRHFLSLFFLIF